MRRRRSSKWAGVVSTKMESDEERSDLEEMEMEEESEEDDELKAAMASTTLYDYKKGLVRPLVPKKTFTNELAGLREKKLELEMKHSSWLERMDLTSSIQTIPKKKKTNPSSGKTGSKRKGRKDKDKGKEDEEEKEEEEGNDDEVDIENDFSREMHFMRQAQASVLVGLKKLQELDIPTQRPDDYFAEMIKTDDHMRKVRERLLSRHKRIEASEKAKKLRELRKYGKKVQEHVLDQRRKEKKEMLSKVKKYNKGKGEKPGFLRREDDDDEFPTSIIHPKRQRGGGRGGGERHGPPGIKNKRRMAKDKKFGFGGLKRDKRNTAQSSADMSMFRTGGRGGFDKGRDGKKSGPKPRPGKSSRQRMKKNKRH